MPSYASDYVDRSDMSKSPSGGLTHAQSYLQHERSSATPPPAPQQQQQQQQQQQYQQPQTQHKSSQYSSVPTDGRPTPAVEDLPGGWPKQASPLMNGGPSGPDGDVAWPLTNGAIYDNRSNTSLRDLTPSGRESTRSVRSKKSIGMESGKRSMELPVVVKTPSTDEDGYFSSVHWNGSRPNGVSKSPMSRSSHSVSNDVGTAVSPPATSPPALPPAPRSVSLAALPAAPAPLSPVRENGQTTDDSMLRVPQSAHRASSPPAFSQASSSMASLSSATAPNRLTHRNTLEVPKVSRTSKDGGADDAIASATGRFSPSTPSRRRGSSQLVRRATRSINSDAHLDELAQDEDAARWTEHIKQKRASKRKRDDDDDRVVVGTKVDQNHVNWVTAYNMLTGLRFTVSRTNAKIDRELTDADFYAKHKFSFDITGNELTPSAKYDFKFKDYAPWVFRHLRSIFQLDPADYLVSLTSKYILSELGSPGKSGSFFYFSRDYKYIIKTIHHAEHKFLRKILKQYYDHVRANPNTLLSQFYGLHRVKIPYGRKIHFVVMNNLFPPHRDIHRTFDLKGSTIGRDFKEEELEKNPRATLKDLNWLRRNLHLEFGPTKKHAFVEQMQRDVALLQKLKIMDYSLLVGIHDLERGNEENLRDKTLQVFQPGGNKADEQAHPNMLMRTPSKLENARKARELRQLIKNERPVPMDQTLDRMPDFMAEPNKKNFYFYSDDGGFRATHEDDTLGEEIYYLGIIDCLTHYSFIKRFEHFWKGLSAPESQISAVPPERYGDRFIKFIAGITKTRERAEYEKEHPEVLDHVGSLAHQVRKSEGTIDDPQLAGVNMTGNIDRDGNPIGTDAVMRKAEKQAEKSKKHGASEADVPERSISAVRNSEIDRQDMVTLPVIGEAAESGSATSAAMTPHGSKESLRGRSPESHPSWPAVLGNANMPSRSLGEVPPPTPPKSDGPTVNGDFEGARVPSRPPPTPPKDDKDNNSLSRSSTRLSRSSLDKDLPPVPHSTVSLSKSPERASKDDLESLRVRVANF
ncbi:hypothetical protein AAFC00_006747 [Neodothiora populina]|uniref:PIPK domain-containing protein n=1 Tax=Neodothiora populina TaxID=2781224 RepID=A0ABR3PBA6_9PEZI